jgi:hypothetical protein
VFSRFQLVISDQNLLSAIGRAYFDLFEGEVKIMPAVQRQHLEEEPEMSPMLRTLSEMKKKTPKLFGGTPSQFALDTDIKHGFHMDKLISDGCVGLRVPQEIMEKRTAKYTQLYQKDADCQHLKLGAETSLEVGQFVIARFFSRNRYIVLRGIALGLDDEDPKMAKILLVDELQIRSISREALYNVVPEFQSKPFLSSIVELDGIPKFVTANPLMYVKYLTGFIDDNRYKEVSARFFGEGEHFQKAVISLPENGQSLGEIFKQEVISQALGKIPTKDEPALGSIVFANSNGDVFIQMEEVIMDEMIDFLLNQCSESTSAGLTEVDINKMYLAPYQTEWYRAKIEKIDRSKGEVRVFYIDYGNHATVKINELILAADIDPFLAKIPPLCTRYHLKWVGKINDLPAFEELFGEQYKICIKEEGKDGEPASVVLFNTAKDEMDDMYCLNKYITAVLKIASRG